MYMLCTTLQLLEQFLLLLLPHQQPPRPPERPRPPEQSPPLLPLDQDAVELLPGPDGAGVHVPLHLVRGRTDQVTCCKSLHPGQHGLIAGGGGKGNASRGGGSGGVDGSGTDG